MGAGADQFGGHQVGSQFEEIAVSLRLLTRRIATRDELACVYEILLVVIHNRDFYWRMKPHMQAQMKIHSNAKVTILQSFRVIFVLADLVLKSCEF